MSDYTKITDFLAKDALASGNTDKLVMGSELDAEFNAIATAIATKANGAVSLSDGDKGDITIASSGTVWTIDAGAVTLAKMADLATNKLIGRYTASTGVPEAISIGYGLSAAGGSLAVDQYLGVDLSAITVTNTVTLTSILGYVVPAAELTVDGDAIVLTAYVSVANSHAANSATLLIKLYSGDTGLATSSGPTFTIAPLTGGVFVCRAVIRRMNATTGRVFYDTTYRQDSNSTTVAAGCTGNYSSTITWANAQTFTIKAQWGSAAAEYTLTGLQMLASKLTGGTVQTNFV